jgi:hypothetical protein
VSVRVTRDDTKPYTLAFAIADLPKSPNAILGAHWTIRAGHADKWRRAVKRAIELNGAFPERPLQLAEVHMTRCSSGLMDDDNLRGSFKAVADALVKLGVLEDDSPKHMLGHYRQEKAPPGKGGVRIRIVDLSPLSAKADASDSEAAT